MSNGTTCELAGFDAGVVIGDDAFLPGVDAPPPDAHVLPDAWVPDAWAPDAWTPLDVCTPARLYLDLDGDGFGDPDTGRDDCRERGLVEDATDCDDTRGSVSPDGTEVCNGLDDDCSGVIDDGVLLTFYVDGDGDTYGTSVTTQACSMPSGYAARSGDCNDGCATCNPGRSETCDGLDNDCDATIDDGVLLTFYVDGDGDTYGTSVTTQACTMPSGYAARSGDCNDGCATCNPGRSETCDGLDNDCDSLVDDGVLTAYYRDADGDLRGLATMSVSGCSAPTGYVTSNDDCNDACATCYPGRSETCDGLDNDCDMVVDDGVRTTFYLDCDGDLVHPAAPTTMMACSAPSLPASCPTGRWASSRSTANDCADQDARAFPGATAYQTMPITGPRTLGQYDFNCDGVETRELTSIALCLDATIAGWTTSTAPACGVSGFWDDCLPPNETRTQGCR